MFIPVNFTSSQFISLCIFAISQQGSMEDLTDEGELHIFSVNQSNLLVQLYPYMSLITVLLLWVPEMAYWTKTSAKLVNWARSKASKTA